MEDYDLSSITSIRHHLEDLKLDTKTPGVRGEARREVLTSRLRLHVSTPRPLEEAKHTQGANTEEVINWESCSNLRQGNKTP